MVNCVKCDRNEQEVRLLDAISGKDIVKICEECSVLEDALVIRRPSSSQIQNSEKALTTREALARLMGGNRENIGENKKPEESRGITLDNLRKPKDYRTVLERRIQVAKKNNHPLNLVENYNWAIMMNRKRRGMSQKQLADAIGEKDTAIKMIENNELPDDSLKIITKIEQYLGVRLRKTDEMAKVEQHMNEINAPARVLKFDKEAGKNITISDLQKMKEAREEAVKAEGKTNISELIWKKGKEIQDREEGLELEEEIELPDEIADKFLVGSEIEFLEDEQEI